MITRDALEKVLDENRSRCAAGARVLCGGRAGRAVPRGDRARERRSTAARSARRRRSRRSSRCTATADFDDALRLVNDSDFGLQAGVFTRDLSLAMRAFEALEVGGVLINQVPTFRVENMPYGGVKD